MHLTNCFSGPLYTRISGFTARSLLGNHLTSRSNMDESQLITHGIAPPSIKSTADLITARYSWQYMCAENRDWAKQCISCQNNTIKRHTITDHGTFSLSHVRFKHVHINIVGQLPSFNGFTYVLNSFDRFTGWPYAVPIRDHLSRKIRYNVHWIVDSRIWQVWHCHHR